MKRRAYLRLTVLINRDFDRPGLRAPEGEVVAADADFDRIAERRRFDRADRRAGHDAHLHQPARDGARTAHGDDPRPDAESQSIERKRIFVGFGPPQGR